MHTPFWKGEKKKYPKVTELQIIKFLILKVGNVPWKDPGPISYYWF